MTFLVSLILGIPLMLLRGWEISVLWSWFVVPSGLTNIQPSVLMFVGFTLIFSAFKGFQGAKEELDVDDVLKESLRSGLFSLIGLGLGALFHAFM